MSTLKKKERKKKKKGTLSDWQAFGLNSSNHAREPAAEAIWKKDLNVFLGNPPPPPKAFMLLAHDKQQVPGAPSPRELLVTSRAGWGPTAGQLFGKWCNRKSEHGGCQLTEAEQSKASVRRFTSITTEKMKVCFLLFLTQ